MITDTERDKTAAAQKQLDAAKASISTALDGLLADLDTRVRGITSELISIQRLIDVAQELRRMRGSVL